METKAKRESSEPNLFKELFPYEGIPKIALTSDSDAVKPPEDFSIHDMTFTVGQEGRRPFSSQQIVELYDRLHRLGGEKGIIRESEMHVRGKQNRETIERCLSLDHPFPQIFAMLTDDEDEIGFVRSAKIKEVGILTPVSDYMISLRDQSTRSEALRQYLSLVTKLIEQGISPTCYFVDITRSDIGGFVIPYMPELVKISHETDTPVKVRLCDDLGLGVSYASAALPRGVPRLVSILLRETSILQDYLGWRGKNLFHLYESSLMDREKPYRLTIDGKESDLIEIPIDWVLDDFPHLQYIPGGSSTGFSAPSKVYEIWAAEFEGYYESGGCFNLTMHPQVIGRSHRIQVLDRLIRRIKGHRGIWFARCDEVARHVLKSM